MLYDKRGGDMKEANPLVRVSDNAGNVFICRLRDLRKPEELRQDDLDKCADDVTWWQARPPADPKIVSDDEN